jgi:hypothetical protein
VIKGAQLQTTLLPLATGCYRSGIVRAAAIALTLLVGPLLSCSDGVSRPNVPPVASLYVPPRAVVGDPVVFDATSSRDLDGTIVEYRFIFGDGTPMARSVRSQVSHAYSGPGAYEVALLVRDDRGDETRASALVNVIPVVPCTVDGDCFPGDRCEGGRCRLRQCLVDQDCGSARRCIRGTCQEAAPCLEDGGCPPLTDGGAADGGPRLVRTLSTPLADAALAWDGQVLWAITEGPANLFLWQVDRGTGAITRDARFDLARVVERPTGLAAVSGLLYLGGTRPGSAESWVVAVRVSDQSFVRSYPDLGDGLAPDGESGLWTYRSAPRVLYRYSMPEGTMRARIVYAGQGDSVGDLAADAARLWAVSRTSSGGRIVEIGRTDGSILRSFDLPELSVTGLAFDGAHVWASGRERLYQVAW